MTEKIVCRFDLLKYGERLQRRRADFGWPALRNEELEQIYLHVCDFRQAPPGVDPAVPEGGIIADLEKPDMFWITTKSGAMYRHPCLSIVSMVALGKHLAYDKASELRAAKRLSK